MAGEVTKAKLDGLKAGIGDLLTKVDALIRAEAYAEKLPIIGDKIATATPALETLTTLSNILRAAVDSVANLSDLSTKTTAQVAQALNDAIQPYLNTLAGNANPFSGTVTATVGSTGDVVLVVDMGRTINLPFTLGDLGMSGLGLDLTGQANAQLAYNLDFRVGADATGFWFDPAQSPLSLTAKVDLNNLSVAANLGILHFAVTNIQDDSPAADADTLSFSIGSQWSTSGLIRNFTTDIVDFRATGTVDLDLHLQGDLSNAALPSIAADFHVDWGFSQSLLNGSGANTGWVAPTVSFTGVSYNFGSYVETVIKPIVDTLAPVLKPINEALAIFRTPIDSALPPDWRAPFDFNTDGKVTLLDFIQKVGGIDTAPIARLIDTIDQITDFAEFLVGKDFSDAGYNIGDYSTTFAAIQGAADALSNLNVTNAGFTSTAPSLGSFLSGLSSGNSTGFGAAGAASKITDLVNSTTLSFPLIESPLQVIKLLIGQSVDLFKFDMPAINLGTGLNAQGNLTSSLTVFTLPIWPVPLVEVKVNVAAQVVADLAFGYDTDGLRYWLAQGANPGNIADIFTHGFYLDDQRSGGTDIAEFVVRAAIELAVTASAGITIGGGGNLIGSIALNLANALTTADGKLHLSDFPAQFGPSNPFAIFDVSGEISAGVRFWVDWPFGNIFNYNSPRLPIANFDTKQDATALGVSAAGNTPANPPPPPGLADVITSGGVTGLWIAVGPRAGERDIDNKTDGAEQIQIGGSGKLVVAGFDKSQLFTLGDFTTIQADAGDGNDEIVIDAGVAVSARLTGGQGNDFLQGGDAADMLYGGTEDDYLAGGAGDDRLDGEDGNDRLEGGAGADALYGAGGIYDTATYVNSGGVTLNLGNPLLNTGDALGDTFFGIEIFEGSNGNDTMVGSAGADILTALSGSDTLQGMGGDDTLAPGLGTNMVDGGDGFDIVNYYNIPGAVTVTGTASGYTVTASGVNDTLTNVEQLDGTPYGDTMTGGSANDIFVGRDGNDVLDGGAGDDTLVGGAGADTLRGGDGDKDRASYILSAVGVTASLLNPGVNTGEAIGDSYQGIEGLRGSEYNDVLSGDNDANLLQGGLGDDMLNGNDGGDTLQGGAGADTLNGGAGKDIASYYNSSTWVVLDLQARANDENDAVNDSFAGIEVYQGTRFSDRLTGTNSAEELWGEEGNDRLRGMGGDDVLLGGAGSDEIDGGDGADTIDGGGDGDQISGGAGIDTILGGAGGDTIHGDGDNDVLDGGDGNDFLYGDAGRDTLRGAEGNDLIDGGADRDTMTYLEAGVLDGVRVNLSSTARMMGGTLVAAFTALDNFGGTDSFAATGTLANVEDVIGSAVADLIVANEGGSEIDTGMGDDFVLGLAGNDLLRGGGGADALDGGDGDDTIIGGAGTDNLTGGAGTDWVSYETDTAGVTASLLTGTATDGSGAIDTLTGFENLRGSALGDTLTGDTNANRIEGLAGNDTLNGAGGADTLVGGAGDDIYHIDNAGGDPTQVSDDTIVEDSGSDLVKSRVNYTLGAGLEDLQLLGPATAGNGNGDSNRMIGNALNNVLDGAFGADTFWGYGGDDTYLFDQLGDRIGTVDAPRSGIVGAGEVAGGGNDTISLATTYIVGRNPNGSEYVWTYSLNDAGFEQVENVELTDNVRRVDLTGNALGNRLVGNDFGQIIRGEGGDDVMVTGIGDDDTFGGDGNDTLVVDWSRAIYGVDMFPLIHVNTTSGGYNGEFRNPNHGWYASFVSTENFHITTGSADDTITLGNGDDIAVLNAGQDFVNIGAGYDRGDGGDGIDGISADYSSETLGINWNLAANTYSEGTDGTANDRRRFVNFEWFGTLRTGSGNDVVVTTTEQRNDAVRTGDGDDRVTFRAGDDDMFGGLGNDTLVVDWSLGIYDAYMRVGPTANATLGGFDGDFANPNHGWYASFESVERFEVTTGSGNDSIVTMTGDDIVRLGLGNDFVNIGSGRDEADGGAGTDGISADYRTDTTAILWDLAANTYSGAGRIFTNFEYFGTLRTGNGNDVVVTTTQQQNEVIYTGDGDDRVTFRAGNDDMFGGLGNDTLVVDWSLGIYDAYMRVGPTVNATLGGFDGDFANPNHGWYASFESVERFEVTTGSGNDSIVTMTGDDIVRLGLGNDFVNIGSGRDEADGGAGTDGISADYRTDTTAILWNLPANTYSGAGRAFANFEYFGTLRTGSGNDVIVTGTHVAGEVIDTGAGDDRVTFSGGYDTYTAGTGSDTLVIDWSAAIYDVGTPSLPNGSLAAGYAGIYRADNHSWSVNYTGVERFEITTGSGNDGIVTAGGDDIVNLGIGNDSVNVGSGYDRADGGAGTDRISADYSAETVAINWDLAANTYSEGNDGTANDRRSFSNFEMFGTLLTGSGNDVVVTTTQQQNEVVRTGDGDDRVTFRAGDDDMFGGSGNDTLVVDWSLGIYDAYMRVGPTANATLGGFDGDFANPNHGWYASFESVERFEVTTGSGNDSIVTASGDDIVRTGVSNDRIETRDGNDMLDGGAGNDTMIGGAGDDVYIVDALGDVVTENAGEGTDTVRTALTAHTLAANVENLTGTNAATGQTLTGNALNNVITGTGFGDTLVGGAGDDMLYGGAGNDFLTAGKGVNDQLFGDAGTDTVVIDGTLANWAFVQLGDGRVRMTDLRDAANAVAYLTGIERVEITGVGSVTMAQAIAGTAGTPTPGTSGNDTVALTVAGLLNLSQGGEDTATGTTGTDAFYFGAALSAGDVVNGGGGTNNQLAIQGNYTYSFSATNLTDIQTLSILSGSVAGFGDAGGNLYSYTLTLPDGSLTGGRVLVIGASTLQTGENLSFDASAETESQIFSFGGKGDDVMIGGAKVDAFFFGDDGRFTPADRLNGGAGPGDQLGLRGDYSARVTFLPTTMTGIETISLISSQQAGFGPASQPSRFNLKIDDANVAAGQLLTVGASTLLANEWVIFDGSAETNAPLFLIGGKGDDTLIGGADDDRLYGNLGADTLRGGLGVDTFIYRAIAESTAGARDTIEGFVQGDHIDLSFIATSRPDGAFEFIGANAFTAAGQVRAEYVGGVWVIEANVDADLGADMTIAVQAPGSVVWSAADFIL